MSPSEFALTHMAMDNVPVEEMLDPGQVVGSGSVAGLRPRWERSSSASHLVEGETTVRAGAGPDHQHGDDAGAQVLRSTAPAGWIALIRLRRVTPLVVRDRGRVTA